MHKLLTWAKGLQLAVGPSRREQLPAALSAESCDGQAHVARASDNTIWVLVKSDIGWKDNFKGTVHVAPGIGPDHVYKDDGTIVISVAGAGVFEELYVKRRTTEQQLEVYFDLN